MPTAKRLKYLAKQKAKEEKRKLNERSKEERQVEVDKVNEHMKKIGIPNIIPEIIKFNKIMNNFLETGNHSQGIISLPGFGREIVYYFTNNKKQDIGVMLKYNSELK